VLACPFLSSSTRSGPWILKTCIGNLHTWLYKMFLLAVKLSRAQYSALVVLPLVLRRVLLKLWPSVGHAVWLPLNCSKEGGA